MLYDRDYNQGPTDEEKQAYKDITGFEFGMERESGRFCRVVSPLSYAIPPLSDSDAHG